jgi:hypothetical protein
MLEDSEKVWRRIEEEIKNNGGKIKAPTKKTWTNPLQEKYQELLEIRSAEYPKAEHYSIEYNRLMDNIRALENVFELMKWDRRP